jgi:hypothetical protein
MQQIIKLGNDDDITSVRSRIDLILATLAQQSIQATGQLEQARLLIIVPRRNKALRSLVNMKLLARMVTSRAVEMAIVSGNPTVRDNARVAGVKAFGAVWHAKLTRWIKSQTPVAKPEETVAPVVVAPVTAEPEIKKKKKRKSKKEDRKRVQKKKYDVFGGSSRPGILRLILQQLGALILVLIFALTFVVGVIALLPEATVTITPVAQSVEAGLVVKADPGVDSVDFEKLTFPARIDQVELDLFSEIETIETELAPTGQTRGQVIFVNRTDTEQTIPISTTVSTSTGNPIEFTVAETATIPAGVGATTTPTLVIAVESGPRGNVSAGQINRVADPAYALLARVVNEQPTGGGTLEPAKVVVQADKERLDAHLRQRIQQEGLLQLQAALGEQEFIPPKSVQVIVLDVAYREFAGDFSDTFGGEMQAVVRATVIGGYNANRLALAALEAQIPPGYELDLEGLNFAAGEILDIRDNIVTFRIFSAGRANPVIDGHKIAQDIAWLPIGEAQDLLSQQYQLATVPGVELKPDWLVELLGRLPFAPLRINVIINDAVTLVADGG